MEKRSQVNGHSAEGLPSNLDAERLVLGSILLDDALFVQAAGTLVSDDFILEKHRRIFRRMGNLHARGEHIDRVTVFEQLNLHGEAQSCDGLAYLVSLDDGIPQTPHFDSYLKLVREKAELHRVISVCQHTMNRAMLGTDPAADILAGATNLLAGASVTEVEAVDLRTVSLPTADPSITVEGLPLLRLHPTFLFGDGGSAKSYLALYLAGKLAEAGISVALFDWELSAEDHRVRLERLFGEGMPRIVYVSCSQPLVHDAMRLQRIVRQHGIEYAVFDSVGKLEFSAPVSTGQSIRMLAGALIQGARGHRILMT